MTTETNSHNSHEESYNSNQAQAQDDGPLDELMAAETAATLAARTAEDDAKTVASAARLIQIYASRGETAQQTSEAADFVIWCSIGCCYETPASRALCKRLHDEAMRLAVLNPEKLGEVSAD